ncbi:hypothetical protein NDU88_000527 [Pleurodeles waltl]|uniref:Uncharacterized protein n=1 Tax=Pleurodeles waltl TaxID=8319 RepID=A0AAV7V886_PLEWA|nr:hypothetical protein NDU88_000527 [Pleurodeles waltl]
MRALHSGGFSETLPESLMKLCDEEYAAMRALHSGGCSETLPESLMKLCDEEYGAMRVRHSGGWVGVRRCQAH